MDQPKKDKKKAMGTPVAGTSKQATGIEYGEKEYAKLQKQKSEIKDPKNQKTIEDVYGAKRGKSDEFEAKAYEKKYVEGDRAKGIKSAIYDGKGNKIGEALQGSDQDKQMKRKYVVKKADTESRRNRNADKLNFTESGKEGISAQNRREQQEVTNREQARLRDEKILAQSKLARDKSKKGGY